VSEESSITQVGSVLGTAAYLAPEQAAGEQAGPAADLYALGVVTYQFLSGRLPYEAQSLTELVLKQQREVPPRLDELNPEVSPQLALAVDRALALDPRQRPPSADDLRRALADGVRGVGPATSATRVAGPATAATTVRGAGGSATGATGVARAPIQPRQPRAPRAPISAPTAAPTVPGRRPPRRRRARRFVGGLLVLLLLAAGGAAAVVATSNSDGAVKLRRVVYDDVEQSIDALKQLVQDNTK
jgi:eukaryotic-like serine/threonine-protein kinase